MRDRQFIKLGASRYEITDVITASTPPADFENWHEVPLNRNLEAFPERFMYDGEITPVKPTVFLTMSKPVIEANGLDFCDVLVTIEEDQKTILDVGGHIQEAHNGDYIAVTSKESGIVTIKTVEPRHYGVPVTVIVT